MTLYGTTMPVSVNLNCKHYCFYLLIFRKCSVMCQCKGCKIATNLSAFYHNLHYNDAIMDSMTSQITSLTIVYSVVYSGADQRKHQSSASLAFVWGIHRDRWIPPQMASNTENVSIWWRHHDHTCIIRGAFEISNALKRGIQNVIVCVIFQHFFKHVKTGSGNCKQLKW